MQPGWKHKTMIYRHADVEAIELLDLGGNLSRLKQRRPEDVSNATVIITLIRGDYFVNNK